MKVAFLVSLVLFSMFSGGHTQNEHGLGTPHLSKQHVEITCANDHMLVVIPKEKLSKIELSQTLRYGLKSDSCQDRDNGTHIVAKVGLKQCGTTETFTGSGLVYSNEMKIEIPSEDTDFLNCPVVSLEFACYYRQSTRVSRSPSETVQKDLFCKHLIGIGPQIDDGILAGTGSTASKIRTKTDSVTCPHLTGVGPGLSADRVLSKTSSVYQGGIRIKQEVRVCKPLEGAGNMKLNMALFADSDYLRPILNRVIALPSPKFQDVYYEISLKTEDPELTIMPSTCFATPTSNPNDPLKYTFLENGCRIDDTVRFYQSTSPKSSRFSITSFKFQKTKSNAFFVHCSVNVCDVKDLNSPCLRRCQRQRVRFARRSGFSRSVKLDKFDKLRGFSKKCEAKRIHVALAKSQLPNFNAKELYLNDKSCKPQINNTHVSFNFKVDQCGTVVSLKGKTVTYRNALHIKMNDSMYWNRQSIGFSCKQERPRRASIRSSSVGIVSSKIPRRYFFVENVGKMIILSKVIAEYPLQSRFTKSPITIKANVSDDGLVSLTSTAPDHFSFRTKHCYLGTSLIERRKYKLIKENCPKKLDGFYYSKDKYNHEELTLDLTKFDIKDEMTYLTCSIYLCDLEDPKSTCFWPCNKDVKKRSRRSLFRDDDYNIDLRCEPNEMIIAMKKPLLHGTQAQQLHLLDPSCRATENSTHITLRTDPNSCGSRLHNMKGVRVYINSIVESPAPGTLILRRKLIDQPFQCTYQVDTLSPEVTIRFNAPVVQFSSRADGHYNVQIDMYDDESFKSKQTKNLVEVDADKPMFFEVKMVGSRFDFALHLTECFGRPLMRQDLREKYVFIQNGCIRDPTVKFYDTDQSDRLRFSVKPFSFEDNPDNSIVVNCYVSACNLANEQCRQGCQENILDERYTVY